MVERNLTRLQDLIDRELVGQRLKRASPLHMESVSALDQLTSVPAASAIDAQARGLTVLVEAEADLTVEADRRMLRSVVTNLLATR
ncbi:MAG: hypothetical protein U0326_09035 [Polyangiales bacterium]